MRAWVSTVPRTKRLPALQSATRQASSPGSSVCQARRRSKAFAEKPEILARAACQRARAVPAA